VGPPGVIDGELKPYLLKPELGQITYVCDKGRFISLQIPSTMAVFIKPNYVDNRYSSIGNAGRDLIYYFESCECHLKIYTHQPTIETISSTASPGKGI